MALNLALDILCPIGHISRMDAKVRIIEYFTTSAGKQPVRSGTKRTQQSDIEKARDYWAQWQKEKKL